MKIIESIITASRCFKRGLTINPKGLMLHSVGCNQPKASVFIRQWNNWLANTAAHGIIEPGVLYKLLPWNHRGWHCGTPGNDTHIGVEMTEPSTIKYTGGSNWIDKNPAATKAFVLGTYATAVESFAYLCKMFNLNPLAAGVVISHSEGRGLGIASNHADVEHIWKKFGLTMNQFRLDVKAAMNPPAAPVSVPVKPSVPVVAPVKPKAVIREGGKVKIRAGARTYTGGRLASFVYKTAYDVMEISGDRVVIGLNRKVTAAVKISDVSPL